MIYLDSAATTKIDPAVVTAMTPYLMEEYGNAGTLYPLGSRARLAVDRAREQVAAFLGAENPDQVVFTSGGTESNNMVFNHHGIFGFKANKNYVVTSPIEHDSILKSAEMLKSVWGFNIIYTAVNSDGIVDLNSFEDVVDANADSISLASVMHSNNEVGSVNDIKAMADICSWYGIPFHTDCVQSASFENIKASMIGCDYISVSSHKIHGPKGVGALYIKDRSLFSPMIYGGKSQEFGLRGGTENVAGIVGFGRACELMVNGLCNNEPQYVTSLKQEFYDNLTVFMKENDIENKLHVNARSDTSFGKILSLRFDEIDAETMVLMLGERGVCVAAGSACTSREQKPSHVLSAIGMDDDSARETIRVSFSRMNTKDEVYDAARIVADTASFLYNIRKA